MKLVILVLLLTFSNAYGLQEEYLDLVKKCLTNSIYKDPVIRDEMERPSLEEMVNADLTHVQVMSSYPCLTSLELLMKDVVDNGIEGDFIETGVWKGGTCIFMRAFLKSIGDTHRTVWVADSFKGLPPPSLKEDKGLDLHLIPWLAISLDEVKANFKRYGLLDHQVKFLRGWFKDTLHKAPIKKLAILRLDGDLYESTMDSLNALYDKVSIGGYVIIDDYGAINACAQAVEDFRNKRGITDTIYGVNWTVAYWQKTQ